MVSAQEPEIAHLRDENSSARWRVGEPPFQYLVSARRSGARVILYAAPMKPPPVQFAPSPGGKIAYQVAGEGPIDLLFHPGSRNLDAIWENPALERFFRRLASFSRLARGSVLVWINGCGVHSESFTRSSESNLSAHDPHSYRRSTPWASGSILGKRLTVEEA